MAILDKEFTKQNIREEAEKALDMFYSLYQNEIEDNCIEVSQFQSFKTILFTQIEDYFNRLNEFHMELEIGDFGFFTQAIKKLRTNSS